MGQLPRAGTSRRILPLPTPPPPPPLVRGTKRSKDCLVPYVHWEGDRVRLASSSENFPYIGRTVCFLEVDAQGHVTSPPEHDVSARVRAGRSQLYAVWPGQYRSDLFLIDDIDEYERAHGVQPDPGRTGLQDHVHHIEWKVNPRDEHSSASYIGVEATLACECESSVCGPLPNT